MEKLLRTRETAAANETRDIATIVDAINMRKPAGCRILTAFKEKFGVDINSARARSGTSRGTHYDFEVEVNGEWKKVEHKGSQKYRVPGVREAPWKGGVQFHNGGCEKYSIARKFAHTWYTMYIASGTLREEFGITAPTPAEDEWFQMDCRTQDDPRTAFGQELKSKVRERRGPKSLLEKRAAVIEALDITEEDKATLVAEVLPIANEALLQKEYWLSIYGSLDSEFHVCWHPQFTIDAVQDITVKKGLDLKFTFVCANEFTFTAHLRWGKGAGFSCLRVDLK